MNTPAISEAARGAPALPVAFAGGALARPQRSSPGGAAARRPAVGTRWGTRPPVPSGRPAREIVVGVLLVVAWALLWSFFLTGVVEPGTALERRAHAAATRWIDP